MCARTGALTDQATADRRKTGTRKSAEPFSFSRGHAAKAHKKAGRFRRRQGIWVQSSNLANVAELAPRAPRFAGCTAGPPVRAVRLCGRTRLRPAIKQRLTQAVIAAGSKRSAVRDERCGRRRQARGGAHRGALIPAPKRARMRTHAAVRQSGWQAKVPRVTTHLRLAHCSGW